MLHIKLLDNRYYAKLEIGEVTIRQLGDNLKDIFIDLANCLIVNGIDMPQSIFQHFITHGGMSKERH